MNGVSNWVIALLVFNVLLIIFMSFFGQTFADNETIEETRSNPLVPNFALGIILGFSSLPSWINTILSLQGVLAIYLLIVSVTGAS